MNQLNKKWTIFVIQHSHVDIGYTERPERVAAYHRQFIGQAVDFALSPRQKEREPAHKFKFTCEAFWAVEQYLARATAAEKERLTAALKSGYMELTALYAHFAGLLDEGHVRDTLMPAMTFAREAGIPVTAALSSDVNGLSQALIDPLQNQGVKYLYTSINPEFGGSPLGGPLKPFYWEAPSSSRILVWSGPTYNSANIAGIIPGLAPGYGFGIPGVTLTGNRKLVDVQDLSLAENKLVQLLQGLESIGYPYDFITLMASGCCYDNSPVSDAVCGLIELWNKKHGDRVMIRTAGVSEFFRHVEQNVEEIPVFRGDWIDWWADGVNSTPAELMVFKNAQRTKRLVEMLDPECETVTAQEHGEIYRSLLLFAEHTWGDSHSVNKPWHFKVQQLLQRKCAHAARADRLAMAALDRVKQVNGEGDFTCDRPLEYTVINPLCREKCDRALLELTITEQHLLKNRFSVIDAAGNEYACQDWDNESVAVPLTLGPNERKKLWIKFSTEDTDANESMRMDKEFENRYYHAGWSEKKGLSSLVLLSEGIEALDWDLPALGSPVYQRFDDAVRNTMSRGEMFVEHPDPGGDTTCGYLKDVTLRAAGPVYTTWEFEYEVAGASEFIVRTVFYRELAVIDINLNITKDTVASPESMYAVFPFKLPGNTWYLDRPGYPLRPGVDQLPGSCCDYYEVQYGAALAAEQAGIAVTMLDTALIMIGDIRLLTYTTEIEPTGPVYSWICSNKWGTNFKSDCGGIYGFRYRIEMNGQFRNMDKGIQACRDNAFPFVTVRA